MSFPFHSGYSLCVAGGEEKAASSWPSSILHGLGLDLHPVQKEMESSHCAMNFKASTVAAERPDTLQRVSSCLVARRKEHIYPP